MTLVGLAFAFVALVWVVLAHWQDLRGAGTTIDDLKQVVDAHIKLALGVAPKPADHAAEIAALTKQVESLKSAVGMKQLR